MCTIRLSKFRYQYIFKPHILTDVKTGKDIFLKMTKTISINKEITMKEISTGRGVMLIFEPGISNLASKLGQIGPKWDKSGTF